MLLFVIYFVLLYYIKFSYFFFLIILFYIYDWEKKIINRFIDFLFNNFNINFIFIISFYNYLISFCMNSSTSSFLYLKKWSLLVSIFKVTPVFLNNFSIRYEDNISSCYTSSVKFSISFLYSFISLSNQYALYFFLIPSLNWLLIEASRGWRHWVNPPEIIITFVSISFIRFYFINLIHWCFI